jgi:hypothetical protein
MNEKELRVPLPEIFLMVSLGRFWEGGREKI